MNPRGLLSVRRADIRLLVCLLLMWAVSLLAGVQAFSKHRRRPLPVASTGQGQIALIDPNHAPWWELTALPRIGELTARKIVAFRRSVRAAAPRRHHAAHDRFAPGVRPCAYNNQKQNDRMPGFRLSDEQIPRRDDRVFRKPDDLQRISGIGPKTVARLRRFLYFPPLRPEEDRDSGSPGVPLDPHQGTDSTLPGVTGDSSPGWPRE